MEANKLSLQWPIDAAVLLRKKAALRKSLASSSGQVIRIAILGGSTTSELRDQLELALMARGFSPLFWESQYGKFWEDAVFGNPELEAFGPDFVCFHTSQANILDWPNAADDAEAAAAKRVNEAGRFVQAYEAAARFGCPVLLNNFDYPPYRLLGNSDAIDHRGRVHYVSGLNSELADWVGRRKGFYLHDLNHLSAWYGLRHWHDRRLWHMAKYCCAYEAIPYLAYSLASMVAAIKGKSKKLLVLDLDNTLWGGVIGDDGLAGIQLGHETPEAEAYMEMQEYARGLGQRGVLLAVASKNEDSIARSGFGHPDARLKEGDFCAFKANWDPKHENIRAMGLSLNLGTDSFVFLDDNPAERALVRGQLPEVAVPEVGADPSQYAAILDRSGYFESSTLSEDDLRRGAMYADNAQRDKAQAAFKDYGEFLASLEMTAEIGPFVELYYDRITQIITKSNQFNLTTRRYTMPEVKRVSTDPEAVTLYGKLKDKFGDNGLVSVVIGHREEADLHIDLWLMSCRVLKRGMEDAMFDALVKAAQIRGCSRLVGYYLPTAKNAMVRDFYGTLGFECLERGKDGESVWALNLSGAMARNKHIALTQSAREGKA